MIDAVPFFPEISAPVGVQSVVEVVGWETIRVSYKESRFGWVFGSEKVEDPELGLEFGKGWDSTYLQISFPVYPL